MLDEAAKTVVHIVEATATGTLSMVVLLANAQAKQGWSVNVIYSRREETPSNLSSLFSKTVSLINVQMASFKEKLTSLFTLRRTLKSLSPDAVFCHSSFGGFLGRVAALGLGGAHYFYLPHCISFMRQDVGRLKRGLFVMFEGVAALKRADYVACSKSEHEIIKKHLPFRTCHLVENAMSIGDLPEVESSFAKHSVVTVGQIRYQKDPEAFAKICRETQRQRPNVEFVWVGDGDAEGKQLLVDAGVVVTGWKTKAEVMGVLSESSIYLSTALWEGLPVSIIEAMLVGIPVVASSCCGNVDVVSSGETGWLFDCDSVAVEQLISLVDNPELGQQTAIAAKDLAISRYSPERYVSEINRLVSATGK